ncbi:MAG TPA: aminotransferase class III-fold pyridoxal phosphate-dependent enzyme [Ktedonobacterales bacterium]
MGIRPVIVQHRAPAFTAQQASHIAESQYGAPGSARLLPGEFDQNFYLRTSDGQEFVLKISPATQDRTVLDLQNRALEHLATHASTLQLPRVAPTNTGEYIATITDTSGTPHAVRLLTYVPGKVLAQVRPHSPELLRSLGSLLGTLDRALLNFAHPAARRTLKWDLAQAMWIHEYLGYIADSDRRALVQRFLRLFEEVALPALPALRASVIYNDANDYNVLVNGPSPQERRVTSVIDFGDIVHTAMVCEPAIACAYAMLGHSLMDKPDPLSAAAHVVAGYSSALALEGPELAVLYPLILARLCISVTNSAYQQAVDPANTYLQVSDAPAWALLERLSDVSPQLAHYTFRQACGLPASPTSPAVVRWLEEHANQIGRVIEPELADATTVVFDLGMSSLELGNNADFADTDALGERLFAHMRSAGAQVGIGRYDEARPIYTTDAYKVEGNDGPEWRTLHTAVDLFLAPGSPVFAPLDGVVHSFHDNAAPKDYGPTIILEHRVDEGRLTFFTLYGHLSRDSLAGLSIGMPVARGAEIARIGAPPENGDWPPHLHFQIITDLLDKAGDFPGVARPSQRDLWLSISPDPSLMLGPLPASLRERITARHSSSADILADRQQRLGSNLSVSYRQPLQIVRGFMQYLYDEDGRAYLDAVNNVPHVGHSHPRVVRAGQRQMAVLNTNTRYLHEDLARYAERLCATLPEPLRVCYFVNSGSEANELALRLARAHSRRHGVVVVDVAYHGNTTTLIDISPYKFNGPGGEGKPPHVQVATMPDLYRGPYREDDPAGGEKYAAHVAGALSRAEREGYPAGAFICESILGCGGQIVLPKGYLRAAYQHVRDTGAVCIADEVQVGFGRAGTHFWAFETQGVVPDIVTMGKPIGNGHPLGAVVTTSEIAASFDNGMEYFNTFGGNPVSCAIGLAVLDVIADEGLQANALATGMRLQDGLRGLMERHPQIGDVRGLGLFVGVELVRDRTTRQPAPQWALYAANRMRERGILISTDGPYHNVLKIKPPLVFDAANADFLVATLDDVLGEDVG